jgi:hypothetical protein
MLAFLARMGRAASSTLGAMTASMNVDVIACAVSASNRSVQPDDAAEGGERVSLPRADVGVRGGGAGRCAARIRVLDDRRGRLTELEDDARGGIEIEQVREGQLLALQDLHGTEAFAAVGVPRGLLMRVLAVAEIAHLRQVEDEARGQRVGVRRRPHEVAALRFDRAERARDGGVVRGRVSERLARQVEPEHCRRASWGVERGEHLRVVRGVDDDEHVTEILRGGTHHARPADVDLLDEIVERHVGPRRGLHERVEVHDDEIDEADAVGPGGLEVLGCARRARMPPCTIGCSVFTRPSIISGNFVTSETLVTGRPASASARAVPPVETNSKPRDRRPEARSTSPDLSETLNRARGIAVNTMKESGNSGENSERPWWEAAGSF